MKKWIIIVVVFLTSLVGANFFGIQENMSKVYEVDLSKNEK